MLAEFVRLGGRVLDSSPMYGSSEHAAITCAVVATSKVQHLRENMGAGHGRMPDVRQRALIAQLAAA